jgi:translocation and assembly module TamB
VPAGEKLSWRGLGRAPDNAQSGDLALLQAAAGTLFGRGDKVGISQKLAHGLGLDEVSLRGSGALTGNVVALGKRLSDKLYVTYEQGIGAAQNLVQLDYTLSRRWSAQLETGTTLSNIGLVYRIVFD